MEDEYFIRLHVSGNATVGNRSTLRIIILPGEFLVDLIIKCIHMYTHINFQAYVQLNVCYHNFMVTVINGTTISEF